MPCPHNSELDVLDRWIKLFRGWRCALPESCRSAATDAEMRRRRVEVYDRHNRVRSAHSYMEGVENCRERERKTQTDPWEECGYERPFSSPPKG
jgi:hypothetical protein